MPRAEYTRNINYYLYYYRYNYKNDPCLWPRPRGSHCSLSHWTKRQKRKDALRRKVTLVFRHVWFAGVWDTFPRIQVGVMENTGLRVWGRWRLSEGTRHLCWVENEWGHERLTDEKGVEEEARDSRFWKSGEERSEPPCVWCKIRLSLSMLLACSRIRGTPKTKLK